jgi:hypothetical protein
MNFKHKNDKGLALGCIKCDWKIAILEGDNLSDLNKFYREHNCKSNARGNDLPPVPQFDPREINSQGDGKTAPLYYQTVKAPAPVKEPEQEIYNNPAENLSVNELLFLILQEIRAHNIKPEKGERGRPKKEA